jgi:aminoglycoside 6-adenylyltransferase
MRTDQEIKKLILDKATLDDRIRAVLLNGSRADKNVPTDQFQDFDIVFVVTEIESFTKNHSWINYFGETIISQLPDEMTFGANLENDAERRSSFSYLMLFKDGNRIDLTLVSLYKVRTDFRADSLTIIWLDKDKLFSNISEATNIDYYIQKPTEKEFLDTCNEFWWVSTYVCKGLLRNEIIYARKMCETFVRPMFMKVIEWYIGTETDFSVSIGNGGKYLKKYLPEPLYRKIVSTYADHQIENNWGSLFTMAEIFEQLSSIVAQRLKYKINEDEARNTKSFLQRSYQSCK